MKKYFLLIFLGVSLLVYSYKIYDSRIFYNSDDVFYKTISRLDYEIIDIQIFEADTLMEFTNITKLPYSYVNGAMIEKNGSVLIMLIPFKYFKTQEEINKTVQHELYHFYFTKNTTLESYEQEGIILNLQDNNIENDYLEFKKMSYKEIIEYIKKKKLNF